MRHSKKFNHLGRKSEHREALLSNMATSLILHKRINTTVAKAKALRIYVEPIITRAKEDSTHSRRMVFSQLKNKFAVSELFREVAVKVADRPGGYTRILKTGTRLGDSAEMCIIELVDFNENMLGSKEQAKGKTTRRSRRTSKKKEDVAVSSEKTKASKVSATKPVEEATVEVVDETEAKDESVVVAEASTEAEDSEVQNSDDAENQEKKEE